MFFIDYELKQKLTKAARKECEVAQVFCVDRPITVAPLQISEQQDPLTAEQQGHLYHRDEIMQMISKPPVGNVSIDELFSKAKESAEKSASRRHFETEKNRQAYITTHGNIVGITGQAGVGKTTLTKIILRKVVDEGLYSADLVFYVRFRDLVYDAKTDLLSFLTASYTPSSIDFLWKTDTVRRNAVLSSVAASKKSIIIMDGFDEATYHSKSLAANHQVDLHQQAKPMVFIKHILQRKLLTNAKVLITSRPKQLIELADDLRPRFTANVLGLDEQAQRQICQDVCFEQTDEVYNFVRSRPEISSYCYTPVCCILLMHTVLKVHSRKTQFSNTLTSVFAAALSLFMLSSHTDHNFDLAKFATLSWNSFQENKFYLNQEDLIKAGLQADEVNAFLVTTRSEKMLTLLGGGTSNVHYFSHLLLQECLIAIKLIFFTTSDEFKKLFVGKRKLKLFKRSKPVYDLAENRFEMITKFTFGFCNTKTFSILKAKFPSLVLSSKHVEILKRFAVKQLSSSKSSSYFQDALPVFHWALEFNDESFSSELASLLPSTIEFKGRILPSDVGAIHHILRARRSPMVISILSDATEFIGDSYRLFLREMSSTMESSRCVEVNTRNI